MESNEPQSNNSIKQTIKKIPILGNVTRKLYRKIRNAEAFETLRNEVTTLTDRLNFIEFGRKGNFDKHYIPIKSPFTPEKNPELTASLLSFVDPKSPWSSMYAMEYTEEMHLGHMKHHAEFIELLKKYAHIAANNRAPKLLEVGMGMGGIALELSIRMYDVYAIDIDPLMVAKSIQHSRSLGGYAKYLCMDALDLSLFKDQSFDVAFSQGTFEHFRNEEIARLIEAQLRVAKYVIFSMPSVSYPVRDYENERRMTVEEWKEILKSMDGEVLQLSYYTKDKWHVQAVLTKSMEH